MTNFFNFADSEAKHRALSKSWYHLMEFVTMIESCLREVELSAVSSTSTITDEQAAAAIDSNDEATMLMADGVTIGYSKRAKKKRAKIQNSNSQAPLVLQESEPRPASTSQPVSQQAFASQPDEEDSVSNAWHVHAVVIAEKPKSSALNLTANDQEILRPLTSQPQPQPVAVTGEPILLSSPSAAATLIILRDMQPVLDLGSISNPSSIIKGIKRVPFDSFGLKIMSLDPGEEGKGSIALAHWTDTNGTRKKKVPLPLQNRPYEIKTIVIHIFSGQHALSLLKDPLSTIAASDGKVKPLGLTMETILVTGALNKALIDLRFQALTAEEGGPSFGISKMEDRLNEAIPAINKALLSILSSATNALLRPFALNLFQCTNDEDLGEELFVNTCHAVSSAIASRSRVKKGKGKAKAVSVGGDDPSASIRGLSSSAVIEMSQLQDQYLTQHDQYQVGLQETRGEGDDQKEEEEEGGLWDEELEINHAGHGKRDRHARGADAEIVVDPLFERRHVAYGGIKPREVQVMEDSEWF